MRNVRFTLKGLSLLVFMFALTSLAHAQATRTWVSGVGDDVNPCSRTAPCKTFAGAISKTFINGEIDALDPGGFGTITITKSITLDGTTGSGFGSILASGTTGVTVNLGAANANDPLRTVRIRNLSINGTGASGTVGTRTGVRGINVSTLNTVPVTVFVEDTVISDFANEGILFSPAGGELIVRNCSIRNNGTKGIFATTTGATLLRVSVEHTSASFNQEGIRFDSNVRGTIVNSVVASNTLNGYVVSGTSEMNIDGSSSTNNKQWGVIAQTGGTIRISNVEVTNNVVNGLQLNAGGSILSNGKNHITTPTMAPSGAFTDQ